MRNRLFLTPLAVISLTIMALLGILAGPANAGLILQPASVTAPSENGSALAVHMIDQTGLSVGYTSGVTDFDTYTAGTTHTNSGGPNEWANVPPRVFPIDLDFDLGGLHTIESLALWNYHGTAGVEHFDLFAASSAAFADSVVVGSFPVANEPSSIVPAQVFEFGPVTASHIWLRIRTNYGNSEQVAIGEVAFEETVLPEPATFAILGLGLAGLGFARRKRTA